MNRDTHWFAVPLLLTVLLGVRFLFSGSRNLRFKLAVVTLLMSFVWTDAYLRLNDPRDGYSYWTRPIRNAFLQAHSTVVVVGVMSLWAAVIYCLITAGD